MKYKTQKANICKDSIINNDGSITCSWMYDNGDCHYFNLINDEPIYSTCPEKREAIRIYNDKIENGEYK